MSKHRFNLPIELRNLSSDPTTNLSNGLMYYNTTTHKSRIYANGIWKDAEGTASTSGGGAALSGLTAGRIPYTTSESTISDDSSLLFDNITNTLTISGAISYGTSGVGDYGQFLLSGGTNGVSPYWSSSSMRYLDRNLSLTGLTTAAVLGTEMITNAADRDFSSDTGNWTGTNWSVTGGVLSKTVSGFDVVTLNSSAITTPIIGRTYYITCTITTNTADALIVAFAGQSIQTGRIVGTEFAAFSFTATSTATLTFNTSLSFGAWLGTIDNVTIKEVSFSSPILTLKNANESIGLEIRSSGSTGVFIGTEAGRSLTTGTQNTAIGRGAFRSNVTGTQNTAIGYQALRNNTNASFNTAIGNNSLLNVTTGANNTGVGHNSLTNATQGIGNVAIGSGSFGVLTSGVFNTAVGQNSGPAVTTGTYNVAIGQSSLINLSTGSYNIAIGGTTGGNVSTGSYNIFLGHGTGFVSSNTSNSMNLGNIIFGRNIPINSNDTISGSVGIGTNNPDRRFHVELEDTNNEGVTYVTRFTHTLTNGTAGTALVGAAGVGIEFELESSPTITNSIGGTLEVILSDATVLFQDYDMSLKTLRDGILTEKVRYAAHGAVSYGTSGYGQVGQVLTSQGNNASPIWTYSNGISTSSNGLTVNGSNVKLGGTLTETTNILGSNQILNMGTTGSKIDEFNVDANNVNINTQFFYVTGGSGSQFLLEYDTFYFGTGVEPTPDDGSIVFGNGSFSGGSSNLAYQNFSISRVQTSNATITEMFLDQSSEVMTLISDGGYIFEMEIIAIRQDNLAGKAWKITGALRKNGASINIIGTVDKVVVAQDAAASTWDVTIDAITTSTSYLRIRVTGESSTNIRWVATTKKTALSW